MYVTDSSGSLNRPKPPCGSSKRAYEGRRSEGEIAFYGNSPLDVSGIVLDFTVPQCVFKHFDEGDEEY